VVLELQYRASVACVQLFVMKLIPVKVHINLYSNVHHTNEMVSVSS